MSANLRAVLDSLLWLLVFSASLVLNFVVFSFLFVSTWLMPPFTATSNFIFLAVLLALFATLWLVTGWVGQRLSVRFGLVSRTWWVALVVAVVAIELWTLTSAGCDFQVLLASTPVMLWLGRLLASKAASRKVIPAG